MGRIWIGLASVLLAAAVFTFPAGASTMLKRTEASMLVTGSVVVEPDGRVSTWEVDQRDRLPAEVVRLVGQTAPTWRFEPVLVDGEAVRARAPMSLRVVVKALDEGSYQLSIRSGHFGDDATAGAGAGTDRVTSLKMGPPAYPERALREFVRGTVYLVLRINRAGAVEDVFAEQVNLRTAGSEAEMKRMRALLSRPALAAARNWTFRIPTTGEDADAEGWSLRVPVDYMIGDESAPAYGEWQAYIPGPLQRAPWSGRELRADEGPDAMIAGRLYQEGAGMKLLTPLAEG
ncbi:energy transducer TonB [Luteimonas sp. A537]